MSMQAVPFIFVDVFSDQPLEGNPLSIVPDADALNESIMRRIAREFNQSETTFILRPTTVDADWRLRCFTPGGHEVFGAGHNALGAWWWLAASKRLDLNESGGVFTQEIGERLLPVEIDCEAGQLISVTMTQTAPVFGQIYEDSQQIAEALGLKESELDLDTFKPQVVSTGSPHLLVPLRTRETVARARPNAAKLLSILSSVSGQGCYVFSLDPVLEGSTAHARFFNPTVGIVEDAATGSAAGPLAALLTENGITAEGTTVVIEQGYPMQRPSLIRVQVVGKRVKVTGRGFITAEGILRLP